MKKSLLLFAAISVLISCAALSPSAGTRVAEILVQDATVIYRGPISRESNARLFELVEATGAMPETLVITSKGGETFAGIELGRWVFENNLDVTITAYCMSSCANYVFPAGNKKVLEPDAAVVWHGGATQQEWNDPCSSIPGGALENGNSCGDIRKLQQETLEEFRAAEAQFFAEIGVDQRVTVLGQESRYDCRGGTESIGWYYSIDDMKRLGIRNVKVRHGVWHPESPAPDLTICRVDLGADFSWSPPSVTLGASDAETLGDMTLAELLNGLGNGFATVRPIFDCVEASSDVDVRGGSDYTDEEYDLALPKLNGLSAEGRQCAEDYKVEYARQVYSACLEAGCGTSHPDGCDAIRPYLLNMGVIFDAGLACAADR